MQAQEHQDRWIPTADEIERNPWKYVGYQSFSKFVSSDNDFFILRRFSALNARVLLGLQDELSSLEERLEAIEELVRQKEAAVHNGSFRQETHEERRQLLLKIKRVLLEYSK